MNTKTLLEAIESHRPNSPLASRNITDLYGVYSKPFNRITILSLFEVPAQLKWHSEKTVIESGDRERHITRHYFSLEGKDYYPKNVADFISTIKSLGKYSLTPRFEGDKKTASILWKPNNNTSYE